MNVSSGSDQETVRNAYIEIVKTVHPDSGHPNASADKFTEVDNAFRILQAKFAKERRGIEENVAVEECDIKVNVEIWPQFYQIDSHVNNNLITAYSSTTSTIFEL